MDERHSPARLVLGIALLWAGGAALVAQSNDPARAGVRSSEVRVLDAIRIGRERSCTFRRLMSDIERSDGIVYVGQGWCRDGLRACFVPRLTVAGAHRLVFVRVNLEKTGDRLIDILAHELQHAIEVLADRSIRSDQAVLYYQKRHGFTGGSEFTFETYAAQDVQDQVRKELRRDRPCGG